MVEDDHDLSNNHLGPETGQSHLEVEVSAVRPPSKGQTPSCQALPAGNNDDDGDESDDDDDGDGDGDDEDDDNVIKTQESAKLRSEAAEVRKELELARAEVRYGQS